MWKFIARLAVFALVLLAWWSFSFRTNPNADLPIGQISLGFGDNCEAIMDPQGVYEPRSFEWSLGFNWQIGPYSMLKAGGFPAVIKGLSGKFAPATDTELIVTQIASNEFLITRDEDY